MELETTNTLLKPKKYVDLTKYEVAGSWDVVPELFLYQSTALCINGFRSLNMST